MTEHAAAIAGEVRPGLMLAGEGGIPDWREAAALAASAQNRLSIPELHFVRVHPSQGVELIGGFRRPGCEIAPINPAAIYQRV